MQAAIAFLIGVAFWHGVANIATTPRWVIAGIASAMFVRWYAPAVIFATYALLSVTWAPNKYDAWEQWFHFAILVMAFTWGYHAKSIVGAIKGFSVAILVSGGIAVLQTYEVRLPIEQGIAPAGLFFNKNFMGEAAALAFVACCQQRLWLYSWMPVLPLCLSHSRASWLAVACSIFLMASVYIRCWMLFAATFLAAHATIDPTSLYQRLDIWQDAIGQLSLWGNGVGSWQGASSDTIETRTFELHNDWLQFIFEYGIVGTVFLATMLYKTFSPFTVCLFVIAFFGFPLHLPATGWLASLMCGHLLGCVSLRSGVQLRRGISPGEIGEDLRRSYPLSLRQKFPTWTRFRFSLSETQSSRTLRAL